MSGQKIALKSQHSHFSDFPQLAASVTDDQFTDKVVDVVNTYLELGWPRRQKAHLLRLVWPAYDRTHTLTAVDRRSLWTLINQEEYLTFKVLPLSRVFPKVRSGYF